MRRLLLTLTCLLPLLATFHKNDLGHWDTARSAMSAPDEFSYLLVADSLLHHHGISLQSALGRDTFYPPGYPALLALLAAPFGELTAFLAHAANAALLCLDTLLAYFLAKRLLSVPPLHCRFAIPPTTIPWLALLIAALFALNWHALETALFVFSEPAFTAATLAWLLLALKNPDWPTSSRKTLPIALLAIAAWSLRGAGITAVAATLLFPLLKPSRKILAPLALTLLLAGAYQVTLSAVSPEKSLAASAEQSANSYPKQLLNGLTHGHELSFANPHDYGKLTLRALDLAFSHLDDFSQAFTPIPRVPPDDIPLNFLGKLLAALALASILLSLLPTQSSIHSPQHFVSLYLLLYTALYLIWPFNMAHLWVPILPLTLTCALRAALTFAAAIRPHRQLVAVAFLLLLGLYAEELLLHLAPYQRRLNYVSDSLADAAAAIIKRSPDPAHTTVCVAGGDELFLYAWYFAHPTGAGPQHPLIPIAPLPVNPATGRGERIESLLTRTITSAAPGTKVFIASYFTEDLFREVFANLHKTDPALFQGTHPVEIFKKEIIAQVWQWPPTPETPASPIPPNSQHLLSSVPPAPPAASPDPPVSTR